MICKGRNTIFCSHLRSTEFACLICIQNWVAVSSSKPVQANHWLGPRISTHYTSKLQDSSPQWSYCLDLQCLVWHQYEFHNFLIWSYFTQFSSVQSLSCVWLFATPWTAARLVSLSFITNSQSLLKLMSIESVMPFNHLILCHPLLLPPSIFPSIRVFSN